MKVLIELENGNLKKYEGYNKAVKVIIIDTDTRKGHYEITDDMEIKKFPDRTMQNKKE